MATKGVLKEAIKQLEKTNVSLRIKLSTAKKADRQKILDELARNDSMILDYQFRLGNEK